MVLGKKVGFCDIGDRSANLRITIIKFNNFHGKLKEKQILADYSFMRKIALTRVLCVENFTD